MKLKSKTQPKHPLEIFIYATQRISQEQIPTTSAFTIMTSAADSSWLFSLALAVKSQNCRVWEGPQEIIGSNPQIKKKRSSF